MRLGSFPDDDGQNVVDDATFLVISTLPPSPCMHMLYAALPYQVLNTKPASKEMHIRCFSTHHDVFIANYIRKLVASYEHFREKESVYSLRKARIANERRFSITRACI